MSIMLTCTKNSKTLLSLFSVILSTLAKPEICQHMITSFNSI